MLLIIVFALGYLAIVFEAPLRLNKTASALLMGVIPFKSLYRYSLASISDPRYLDTVNKLFLADEKPICMTWF